jgi:hypothetical protein
MKLRLIRLEERGAKKRQSALEAMTDMGLTKLEQPDFAASALAGCPSHRHLRRRCRSRQS